MATDNFLTGKKRIAIPTSSIRAIFGFALLVGALSIAIGIFLVSPFVFAMLIPLTVIIAFAYICPRLNNADLSASKIGDSCYFLGFSLTLVSIALSLVSLQQNTELSISSVIGGFGGALTTTIAGLIARLWLTTLSPSFQSRQERIQEQLDRTVNKFTASIESTVETINLSLTSIGVTVEDANEEVKKSYADGMKKSLAEIQETISAFSQRLDEVEVSPELVVDPVNNALEGLIETISAHNTKIAEIYEKVSLENMKLSEQIDQSNSFLFKNISNFNAKYEAIVDRQLEYFKKNVDEVSSSIISSFGDMKDIKIETSEEMESTIQSVGTLLKDIRKILQTNNEISSISEEKIKSLNDLVDATNTSFPKLQNNLANLSTPVVSVATQIANFKTELIEMKDAMVSLKESAVETKKDLSKQKKSIDRATKDLSQDITDLYSSLAAQIKAIKDES